MKACAHTLCFSFGISETGSRVLPVRPIATDEKLNVNVTRRGSRGDLLYGLEDAPAVLSKRLQKAPAGWPSPIGFF